MVVRALGWIGILTEGGPINQALHALGLVAQPIDFFSGNVAVVIGLVHRVRSALHPDRPPGSSGHQPALRGGRSRHGGEPLGNPVGDHAAAEHERSGGRGTPGVRRLHGCVEHDPLSGPRAATRAPSFQF